MRNRRRRRRRKWKGTQEEGDADEKGEEEQRRGNEGGGEERGRDEATAGRAKERTEKDDGGLSSACHRSQPQTESGLYNYGLSPHQSSSGRGRKGGGGGPFVYAGARGREVIGVQSLAQIVFYRLSHLAFKIPATGDPEGD